MKKKIIILMAILSALCLSGCKSADDADEAIANAMVEEAQENAVGAVVGETPKNNEDDDFTPEIVPLGELPDTPSLKCGSFEYSGENIDVLRQKLKDYLGDDYNEIQEDGNDYIDIKGNTPDGFLAVRIFTKVVFDAPEDYRMVVIRNYAYSDEIESGVCKVDSDELSAKYTLSNVSSEMTFKEVAQVWGGDENSSSWQWYSPSIPSSSEDPIPEHACCVKFSGDDTKKVEITFYGVKE